MKTRNWLTIAFILLFGLLALPIFAQGPVDDGLLGEALPMPTRVTSEPVAPTTPDRGGITVNPQNRQESQDFYQDYYLPSEGVDIGWTGDHESCNAGTTSQAFRQAVALRINYFRAMAGVPADMTLNDTYNSKAQQAALMMSVNGQLSHDPPSDWECYTEEGAEAAGSSNLFLGVNGASAVTGYIQDPGASNFFAGHRRWILYPQTEQMGSGDIPSVNGKLKSNALWVFDNTWGTRPETREEYVAWPPPGYVPYQVVFARWSFSYHDADFSEATVNMTSGGSSVSVEQHDVTNGFGENTLVWIPMGLDSGSSWPQATEDTTYIIEVSNVLIDGTARTFEYEVTVFDSAVATPTPEPNSTPTRTPTTTSTKTPTGTPSATAMPTNENVELISQIGGSTEAVAAVGDYAYVGVGPRLVILDISNSSNPQFVGQTDVLPNTILDVAVVNNYAYVVTTGSGLRIINVSDRTAPYEEGAFDSGYASGVAVVNNYAYVANGTDGLRIINVAQSNAPSQVGALDTPGYAKDVAVVGSHAYVADGGEGLRIIDISSPSAPQEVGSFVTEDASSVAVASNYAYIADGFNEDLHIINVASPTSPNEVARLDTGVAYDVTLVGNELYVAESWYLRIINVANPQSPIEMDTLSIQGNGESIAVTNNIALVAASYGGLQLINVANPSNASRVSTFDTWMAAGVAVTGNYADVADGWNGGLYAIHVGDPAAPDLVGSSKTEKENWTDWRRMAIANNYAYLGGRDLRIIDINSPSAPSEVGTLDTPGDPYGGGVAIVGQIAYLADGEEGGLRLINISEPEAPIEVGAIDTPGDARDVAVYGNYAYVADGEDGGLRIINVSNPSAPSEVGFYDTPGDAYGVAVAGNYAYIAEGRDGGLRLIDISNPQAPFETGAIDTSGWAHDVAVVGDLAYVADHYEGLRVIDITNRAAPTEVGSYDTPGFALNVTVANGYAYVADRHAGLLVLRYTGNTPTPTPTPTSTPTATPPPPDSINLDATAGLDSINVGWNLDGPLSGDLDHYELYRSSNGGNYDSIATTMGTQYTDEDPNLTPNVEYCYQVNATDSDGNVIGLSNTACTQFGSLTLWVPHQVVQPGSTDVPVTINLANGNGLCPRTFDIKVEYDEQIVEANGTVGATIYTAGYAFETNTTVPGEVKISAIIGSQDCAELYGAGRLFDVFFNVQGQEGDVSTLDFITGLTATVIYDKDDLINPVPLVLENGSLTVGFDFIRGDVNGDGAVNAADAALALDIASGLLTPTSQQEAACDANGDNACNSADSSLILCHAAFQDWNTCGGSQQRNSEVQPGIVRLEIDSISQTGSTVVVPVKLSNASHFAGGHFIFTYDANKMTALGASLTSLTNNFQIATNLEQPGMLGVALASKDAITTDGTVLELEFTITSGVSSIDFGSVRLNDTSGRDFETSALQSQIQVVPHDEGAGATEYQLYLPAITR